MRTNRLIPLAALFALLHPLSLAGQATRCPDHTQSVSLNTGANSAGVLLPGGSTDPQWTIIKDPFTSTVEPRPASVLIDPHPAWATIPQTKWISSQASSTQGTNGDYFYRTCFCLRDGFTRPSLQLSLRADDKADVFLNNTLEQIESSTPPAPILQGAQGSFSTSRPPDQLNPPYTGPFQTGENCLIVRVRNTGGVVTGLDLAGSITASGPNGAGSGVVIPECCRRTGSICGTKWNDLNNDGTRQSPEPGLPGWTIQLSNGQSAVTDQFGNYCFSDLSPGGYTIKEVNQPGWVQTLPKASGSYSVTVGAATATGGFDFGNCNGPACAKADFTFPPACAGEAVPFTNASTGTVSNFSWSFTNGNPATSTAASPSASFPAGSHPVKLCINGGTAPPLCMTKTVPVRPRPAAPVINGPITSCNAPATYCVNPADPSLTYSWSVSSPHTLTGGSTGSCVQVNWSPPGQGGVVTVTATNKEGCSNLSRIEVKPCVTSLAECCQCNELSVKNETLSGSTFSAVVTASPMPMTRVAVDLISTMVTPSAGCGTAGPRDSSINTAGSSLPPLTSVSQPVTPGREILFAAGTPAPLVNAPLTLNLQLPPVAKPSIWCGDSLRFCLKYSFTGRDCKSCELIECYGPYQRGGLIIDNSGPRDVSANQRFNVSFAPADGDGTWRTAPGDRLTVRIKPGTGAPGARLLGTAEVAPTGSTLTFTGLSVDRPGEGYVLELLSGPSGNVVAESAPFNVGTPASPR